MRAVFDTNVVISALVFGQRLAWLRTARASGAVTPVICKETTAELLRELAYPKFRPDAAARDLLLADYLPFAEIARLPHRAPDLPVECRGRDDVVFLYLTIENKVDPPVSGDAGLTVLANAYPVASPTMFREL